MGLPSLILSKGVRVITGFLLVSWPCCIIEAVGSRNQINPKEGNVRQSRLRRSFGGGGTEGRKVCSSGRSSMCKGRVADAQGCGGGGGCDGEWSVVGPEQEAELRPALGRPWALTGGAWALTLGATRPLGSLSKAVEEPDLCALHPVAARSGEWTGWRGRQNAQDRDSLTCL